MSFFELLKGRRMCRSYAPRSVPRADIVRVLEAARRAPSAGHAQGVRFAVITAAEAREQIAQAYHEDQYAKRGFPRWLSGAPVHLIVAVEEASYHERYAEPDKKIGPDKWPVSYPVMDSGQSLMTLYLAAEELGLSCGYLGPHTGPDLVNLLKLPESWRFIGLVTLGYRRGPEKLTKSVKRGWRPLDEVVRWM